ICIEQNHLARHIYLNFLNDGQIASYVADKYFFPELGARSLAKAVNTQICHKLTAAFLEQQDEITDEMNDKPFDRYDVRLQEVKGGFKEITIKLDGVQKIQTRPVEKCGSQQDPSETDSTLTTAQLLDGFGQLTILPKE
ncbi:MAG: hypothetical protein Q9183_006555, partial [Haloplaca sp. 2 TL-2023]